MNRDSYNWNMGSLQEVLWQAYARVLNDIEDDPEALVRLKELRDLVPAAISMMDDIRDDLKLNLAHVAGRAVMKFKGIKSGRYYPGYHEDMKEFVKEAVKNAK